MARPKAFDPDTVLDQVTHTFWAQGYANTSIADLEAATGLGRQSLYATFGDKHELFLRSLERYACRASAGVVQANASSAQGLDALRDYLLASVDAITDSGWQSCFMVNTILEFGGRDADVRSRCNSNTRQLASVVTRTLLDAQARGELRDDADVPALARMLTAQLYGLSVLAKDGASRADLVASVLALVAQLRRPVAAAMR